MSDSGDEERSQREPQIGIMSENDIIKECKENLAE